MCQPTITSTTTSANQEDSSTNMVSISPYQSYIQMLLPTTRMVMEEGMSESASLPITGDDGTLKNMAFSSEKVIIKICFDNARALTDEASMTVRSRQKQKMPKIMSRWSSVPDMAEVSAQVSSSDASTPRSLEDFRSLRTQNSMPARSSDDLRMAARNSLLKKDEAGNRNDRWHISSNSNKTKKTKSAKMSQPKNSLFDLTMPGLPLPLPAGASAPFPGASPGSSITTTTGQLLKRPQRKNSMEGDSILKTILNRFETTQNSECSNETVGLQ